MADLAIAVPPSDKRSKKEVRKLIHEKLSVTLADYKTVLGEKKFESRIRKAARSFGADILKAMPKKQKKQKKVNGEKALD